MLTLNLITLHKYHPHLYSVLSLANPKFISSNHSTIQTTIPIPFTAIQLLDEIAKQANIPYKLFITSEDPTHIEYYFNFTGTNHDETISPYHLTTTVTNSNLSSAGLKT